MKCPLRRIEAAAACAVLQPSELIFDDGAATAWLCALEGPSELSAIFRSRSPSVGSLQINFSTGVAAFRQSKLGFEEGPA
jgi:hypothetical protein